MGYSKEHNKFSLPFKHRFEIVCFRIESVVWWFLKRRWISPSGRRQRSFRQVKYRCAVCKMIHLYAVSPASHFNPLKYGGLIWQATRGAFPRGSAASSCYGQFDTDEYTPESGDCSLNLRAWHVLLVLFPERLSFFLLFQCWVTNPV